MNVLYVTTLNNAFIIGALITINSLVRCCKNNPSILILYWEEISEYNKKLLDSVCSDIQYKQIKLGDYPEAKFDSEHRSWGYNCHYRYDIFEAGENYDKVIYFDCDIIFNTVLDDLEQLNVDFAAVFRPLGVIVQIGDRQGFDAGVMIVGKKYLTTDTKLGLISLSQSTPPLDRYIKSRKWTGNEPVLNTYFKAHPLPEKYNFCTDLITNDNVTKRFNLQFIGHRKPWSGDSISDQFDQYIIDKIVSNNGRYYTNIVIKKILGIYNKEKEIIMRKTGIDIDELKDNC